MIIFKEGILIILLITCFLCAETNRNTIGLQTDISINSGKYSLPAITQKQKLKNEIYLYYWITKQKNVQNNFYINLYPIFYLHVSSILLKSSTQELSENRFIVAYIEFYCLIFYYSKYRTNRVFIKSNKSCLFLDFILHYEFKKFAKLVYMIKNRSEVADLIFKYLTKYKPVKKISINEELNEISLNSVTKLHMVFYKYGLTFYGPLVSDLTLEGMFANFINFSISVRDLIGFNFMYKSLYDVESNTYEAKELLTDMINVSDAVKYGMLTIFNNQNTFDTNYKVFLLNLISNFSIDCKFHNKRKLFVTNHEKLKSVISTNLREKINDFNEHKLEDIFKLAHMMVWINHKSLMWTSDVIWCLYIDLLIVFIDELIFKDNVISLFLYENLNVFAKILQVGYFCYHYHLKRLLIIEENCRKGPILSAGFLKIFDINHSQKNKTKLRKLLLSEEIAFYMFFKYTHVNILATNDFFKNEHIISTKYFPIYYAIFQTYSDKKNKDSYYLWKEYQRYIAAFDDYINAIHNFKT